MRLINPERLIEDKGFFIEDDKGRMLCVVAAQDIRDAQDAVIIWTGKKGHWITHGTGKDAWAECSECHVCGSPQWKICPVCETKMDGGNENA